MKIVIMTLGCKVNKYESDSMAYVLSLRGHEVSDQLEWADAYIINTCAVTAEAEKKSRQMIARCKKFNPDAKIYICGCASEHNKTQFEEKGVTLVRGNAEKIKLVDLLDQGGSKIEKLPDVYEDNMRALPSRTRTYIKIQDGCNNFCTYCIIPYLRGRSRSREIFSILQEANELGDDVKEIVLTGINVTDYKINGEPALLTLLAELDKFGKRLRLSSMEDTLVKEDFVKGLAALKNFCPHFHLSLQSGCESVLRRMNRHYSPGQFLDSVKLIRKYFPNAAITTDVIVGFPDESDSEFEESFKFIKKVGFSDLHIFQYSLRPGTVASRMKDLPPEIKQSRFERLNELKQRLEKAFIKKNKHGKVLVEEKIDDFYVGYTENYIKCYIKSNVDIINNIVEVKIKGPFKDGASAKIKKVLPETVDKQG